MDAKLYGVPASHPSNTAELMLRYKGIPYKRVDLVNVVAKGQLRAMRFPETTVPALKIDGRRVQGSRRISRFLDEHRPEPPLFPADPQRRADVEEAERWGECSYQPVPRRMFRWALARDNGLRRDFADRASMPLRA